MTLFLHGIWAKPTSTRYNPGSEALQRKNRSCGAGTAEIAGSRTERQRRKRTNHKEIVDPAQPTIENRETIDMWRPASHHITERGVSAHIGLPPGRQYHSINREVGVGETDVD